MKSVFREKLSIAFEALSAKGIVAMEACGDCGTCATSALIEFIDTCSHHPWRGYAYWSEQDDLSIDTEGEVYIGFGAKTDTDEDAIAVGTEIAQMLADHGLFTYWHGDPNIRILCTSEENPDKHKLTEHEKHAGPLGDDFFEMIPSEGGIFALCPEHNMRRCDIRRMDDRLARDEE